MLYMRSVDDLTAVARIRDAAIEQFGRHGFDVGLRAVAKAAGVSAGLVIHHFGSKDGLRKACDDYIAEQIRIAKTEAIASTDPTSWLGQIAEIESYAPMTAYLIRSMQSGGELAKAFWHRLIDDTERYLQEGVRAGTVKTSRDARARAKYLAMSGSGSLLLYLQLHPDPSDLRAVLRDYSEEMMLPAMEIYTNGLMADATMYDAFVTRREHGIPLGTPGKGEHDDGGVPATG